MPLPVNDGLTVTEPIKIFKIDKEGNITENLLFEFSISFRPVRGFRAIAYRQNERMADGERLEAMMRDLILSHVMEIDGIKSRQNGRPYEPKDVSKIIEVLDPISIQEIVATLKQSAWDIEKMLGN